MISIRAPGGGVYVECSSTRALHVQTQTEYTASASFWPSRLTTYRRDALDLISNGSGITSKGCANPVTPGRQGGSNDHH